MVQQNKTWSITVGTIISIVFVIVWGRILYDIFFNNIPCVKHNLAILVWAIPFFIIVGVISHFEYTLKQKKVIWIIGIILFVLIFGRLYSESYSLTSSPCYFDQHELMPG
jgi:predicted tellurium resistance membrane protein TerC